MEMIWLNQRSTEFSSEDNKSCKDNWFEEKAKMDKVNISEETSVEMHQGHAVWISRVATIKDCDDPQ